LLNKNDEIIMQLLKWWCYNIHRNCIYDFLSRKEQIRKYKVNYDPIYIITHVPLHRYTYMYAYAIHALYPFVCGFVYIKLVLVHIYLSFYSYRHIVTIQIHGVHCYISTYAHNVFWLCPLSHSFLTTFRYNSCTFNSPS
jgi:hypothetical protein